MADDAVMREAVLAGRNVAKDGGPPVLMMMERLLGAKGPARAVVSGPMKPLFAYAEEVKAAREAYPKAVEKLELDKVSDPAGPAKPE
jgi:hypothetical protein